MDDKKILKSYWKNNTKFFSTESNISLEPFCQICGKKLNSISDGYYNKTKNSFLCENCVDSLLDKWDKSGRSEELIGSGELEKAQSYWSGESKDSNYIQPSNQRTIELQSLGILFIFCGILSLIFSNYFDPIWGSFIIFIGFLNIIIHHRIMFILDGIIFIFVGITNFAGGEGPWKFLGMIQVYWGISIIKMFKIYKK